MVESALPPPSPPALQPPHLRDPDPPLSQLPQQATLLPISSPAAGDTLQTNLDLASPSDTPTASRYPQSTSF